MNEYEQQLSRLLQDKKPEPNDPGAVRTDHPFPVSGSPLPTPQELIPEARGLPITAEAIEFALSQIRAASRLSEELEDANRRADLIASLVPEIRIKAAVALLEQRDGLPDNWEFR